MPKEEQSLFTNSFWSSVTDSLQQYALIASSTVALIFGIILITGALNPRSFSINSVVFPAAIDTTKLLFSRSFLDIDGRSVGKMFGFTAKTTASAKSMRLSGVSLTHTENSSLKRRALVLSISYTDISSALKLPDETAPPTIAEAIFPAPKNPIFILTVPHFRAPRCSWGISLHLYQFHSCNKGIF